MLAYIRSHTRGGATNSVGRIERNSPGIFERPSLNHTGMPWRITSNSSTSRCVMCAEGRNTSVESVLSRSSDSGPIAQFTSTELWLTRPIFGSPVAPEVRYRIAMSSGRTPPRMRSTRPGSSTIACAPSCLSRSRLIAFSASPVNKTRCAFTSFSPALSSACSIFGFSTKIAFGSAAFSVFTWSAAGRLVYTAAAIEPFVITPTSAR